MSDKELDYEKVKQYLKELRDRIEYSNIVRTNVDKDLPPKACSFCGKSSDERTTIIEGPAVLICNVCVRLCQDILDAKGVQ